MTLAPIVLFAYNRPELTEMCLSHLAANHLADQSTLIIYCDGPKDGATDDELQKISRVREIAGKKSWCGTVHVIESDHNKGLSGSIIKGVSEIVEKHGRVIVLEDDLETSPFFLKFMNDALDTYEQNTDVLSIGACNFFAQDKDVPDSFFIPIPDCWGWATWADRWKLFEKNGHSLLKRLSEKNLLDSFNLEGNYPFQAMLEDQVAAKNDSWAIRWQAVAYITGKLSLYPGKGLTKHKHSAAATNTGGYDNSELVHFPAAPLTVSAVDVTLDPDIMRKMNKGYAEMYRSGVSFRHKLITALAGSLPYKILKKIKNRAFPGPKTNIQFEGNYANWDAARQQCSGYEEKSILDKIIKALTRVRSGEAAFERDSVLFYEEDYNWALVSAFYRVLADGNKLNVIDFGGSLGSTYFQNRKLLAPYDPKWSIVEQSHFTQAGRSLFEDDVLRFYETVEACVAERNPNILLLSSVLQYLPEPDVFLTKFLKHEFQYIILDKITFISGAVDRLTVQTVPPSIYEASYPAWFFSKEKFMNTVLEDYEMVFEFDSEEGYFMLADGVTAEHKGYLLKRKTGRI